MAGGGWIKLYRSIQDHWIWENPTYLKWWLDLLLMANHKSNEVLVNGTVETINIGERLTSEIKLAERWEVNRKQVRRFLNLLEKNGMISLEKSRQKGTTYKVLKYKDYQQFSDSEKDIKRDNGRDNARDNDRDINKNDKNEKNDKNNNTSKKSKKRIYSDDDPNKKLAKLLLKHIEANQEIKEPDLDKWANTIRLTIEADKRSGKDVQDMILWATQHNFWSGVVLSPTSLRRNWDKMAVQKNKKSNKSVPDSELPETGYDW